MRELLRQVVRYTVVFLTMGCAGELGYLLFGGNVGIFVGLVMLLVATVAPIRFLGRRRSPSKGLYWRGYVAFEAAPLVINERLFPDVHRLGPIGLGGRRIVSSGRCEMREEGLNWRCHGYFLVRTRVISGAFCLPWSAVERAEAHRIPDMLPLGGAFTLELSENRGVIEGEFLGSLRGLSEALELSRRAPPDLT
jgi:hypothetical protein